ncbi:M23 family metallopeptidase [Cumulibacter manganitolerans]|uniref:M23 family metallopeptidase n=1 Tax=Cumulibacter manganitolerans TaxID=1884992 RepID=UPI001296EE36|nr:M23 family metallopeptidase [Cumulibacter manganitolerans]
MNRLAFRTTLLALLVAAAQLLAANPSAAAAGYRWPLDGAPPVMRGFDPPPKPWLPGHRGVDLAAAPGAAVFAAADGTVAFDGSVAGKPVVSIDHPGGVRTTYEPVVATVRAGQGVTQGQQIGVLQDGHPECAADACLHWGARRGEVYLDPLRLLRPRQVRLLPL